jgi:S1-C subfamily serine protease
MWLTIRTGPERGRTVHVDAERFVLGRDDGCDLTIDDVKISRRHAALAALPDGRTELRDLGSSNGTFVDGQRVESAILTGDEQIQLGKTLLVSTLVEPAPGKPATVLGSILSGVKGLESPSAAYRKLAERSMRRATVLGGSAILIAAGAAAVFATGVLGSHGGTDAAVERVVRAAAPSTFPVEALDRGVPVERGTGWVLDGQRGLIVTNAHVINGGTAFQVGIDGTPRRAELVGVAPCEDLAVLKVSGASGLRRLPLGDQSTLALGETVVAVGYAANASQEQSLTSTTGVVSIVRSSYREAALDVPRYPNVIQTDAAINPGNSGGPLLDLEGTLVGVTSAGRTLSPDGRIIQGQSYAIGVDRVKEITDVLRRHRSLGWTGAGFEYATEAQLRRRKLPAGIRLGPIVPGTQADKAGLREGLLIVAVNGMEVASLAGYCDAIAGLESGRQAAFTVIRPASSAAGRRTITVPLQ